MYSLRYEELALSSEAFRVAFRGWGGKESYILPVQREMHQGECPHKFSKIRRVGSLIRGVPGGIQRGGESMERSQILKKETHIGSYGGGDEHAPAHNLKEKNMEKVGKLSLQI